MNQPTALTPTIEVEVPIAGMDCADCTQHVRTAIAVRPGVQTVEVLLSAEKAVIQLDPTQVDLPAIHQAVATNVLRAALRRQIISHTLLSVGVVAALVVGQWATAAVIVFFMRVGDYAGRFTAERARRAVKDLTALAPRTARVERAGTEQEEPIAAGQAGVIVVVRPGEQIPVDGEVLTGQATVDQATITGESMPVEVSPGARVFATTIPRLGSLRVRTTQVGADTTFGRVIRLVEEAESHRADVQRIADRFSAYYLLRLVPEAFQIARRTMGVIRSNLAFTVGYNVIGLTLAALGFLPPVFAAAAQSLPDLGILANSARLLRQK